MQFSAHLLVQNASNAGRARHPIAGHEDLMPDRLEPVRRQGSDNGGYRQRRHELDGENSGERRI
jgi:hypothetical protein